MAVTLNIESCGLSDVGRVRSGNEDFFLIDDTNRLYIVADGMGGHAGGERASRLAVEQIEQEMLKGDGDITQPPSPADTGAGNVAERTLMKALKTANNVIHSEADKNEGLKGMGTTVTALCVRDNEAIIGHVGDSRAYLIRQNNIMQVTEDHSWVNEQVKAGFITPEEARTHKFKNVITRSLGHEKDVQVDIFSLALNPGDRFLLCSDGLTGLVEDPELLSNVSGSSMKDALNNLIELANNRGGHDNITAVLISVTQ